MYPQFAQRGAPIRRFHTKSFRRRKAVRQAENLDFTGPPSIAGQGICAWIVPGKRTLDSECEQQLNRRSVHAEWQHHAKRASEITRELGAKWLREKASVVLKVPCAIGPQASNYVFNPLHPDASHFTIVQTYTYPFDMRIKQ